MSHDDLVGHQEAPLLNALLAEVQWGSPADLLGESAHKDSTVVASNLLRDLTVEMSHTNNQLRDDDHVSEVVATVMGSTCDLLLTIAMTSS